MYAPLDPNDYGGPSENGEKLWMTGAASELLSAAMVRRRRLSYCCLPCICNALSSGSGLTVHFAHTRARTHQGTEDDCCGTDSYGGCGKCILVKSLYAENSDWSAIVMKKSDHLSIG